MTTYFENQQGLKDSLISIKTKKHKSLGVLSLVFMRLFFEKSFILTIEEVVEHFSDLENNDEEKINFADASNKKT